MGRGGQGGPIYTLTISSEQVKVEIEKQNEKRIFIFIAQRRTDTLK